MNALGLLETTGFTPAIAALDVIEKSGPVQVLQAELNDFLGVCIKLTGPVDALAAALENGRAVAEQMGGKPVIDVIQRLDPRAFAVVNSPPEFNELIQQAVVVPGTAAVQETVSPTPHPEEPLSMSTTPHALGLIETQGFTAVFDAVDTACKAANVEVIGKEKLGGGYVTVVIRGDVAAVTAAVEAGSARVAELGTLIAAHVIARPSPAVLSLLPKS